MNIKCLPLRVHFAAPYSSKNILKCFDGETSVSWLTNANDGVYFYDKQCYVKFEGKVYRYSFGDTRFPYYLNNLNNEEEVLKLTSSETNELRIICKTKLASKKQRELHQTLLHYEEQKRFLIK